VKCADGTKYRIRADNKALLRQGLERKRSGALKDAKEIYMQALRLDPCDIQAYISMGKVSYLLGQREDSIRSYLAAIHLQIFTRENFEDASSIRQINHRYDQLDSDIKELLPMKSATVILEDANTPRNIAHSVLDLDDTEPLSQSAQGHSQIYHSQLAGNGTFNDTLTILNVTEEEFDATEYDYLSVGKQILLDHINWKQINDVNVAKIYFSKKSER